MIVAGRSILMGGEAYTSLIFLDRKQHSLR